MYCKAGLPEPPGAGLFGCGRSRIFGPAPAPAPTPTLQYSTVNNLFLRDPKYEYEHDYDYDYDYD